MRFICPLITDANRRLDNGTRFVNEIITPVDIFFSKYFDVNWRINTVITTSLPWLIISEDGVGGKTCASDFVVLVVNPEDTAIR